MTPECHVSGTLKCEEFTVLSRGMGWTVVQLDIEHAKLMAYRAEDGKFHFYLPPGEYVLHIGGKDIEYLKRSLVIAPGQKELALGDIPVRAKKLALLPGKPAPELRGVVAWKNTRELKLADLRDKWTLLAFSGAWGNAGGFGIGQTRELLAAHEKHNGLVIIDVYMHVGDDPPKGISEDFDRRFAVLSQRELSGRELPYAVALTRAMPPAIGSNRTRDAIATDYGITHYPISVLIDPKGKIVGEIELRTPEGRAQLDRLLAAQKGPQNRD